MIGTGSFQTVPVTHCAAHTQSIMLHGRGQLILVLLQRETTRDSMFTIL